MTSKAKNKKFYVYLHRYASGPKEGRVFYVGKGSHRRAGSSYGRSKYWHRIKSKYGFTHEIVSRFDSEFCAYSFEKILIGLYGRENLCNLTDGGDGSFNPTQETRDKISNAISGDKHYKFKNEIVKFSHPELGSFSGTMYDFYTKYGIPQKDVYWLVKGERLTAKGWMVGELRELDRFEKLRGSNHYGYDHTVHYFQHSDGRSFTGTQYEFRKEYGFPQASVRQLVVGGVHTVHGWWIGKGPKPKRKTRDCSEYVFSMGGVFYIGRIKKLSKELEISETSLGSLRDGKAKSIKGVSFVGKKESYEPTSLAA